MTNLGAKGKKKQLDTDAVPLTSLCDMMFLLLIFFIMTTTLSRVTGFLSEFPAGTRGQPQEQKERTPTIALKDRQIAFNDQSIAFEDLRAKLKDLRLHEKPGEGRVVILTAGGTVPYQDYYATLSLISAMGGVPAITREDDGKEKK